VLPPVTETLTPEEEEAREEKRKELLKKRYLYATTQEEYDMYVAAWEAMTEEWKDKLTVYSVDPDKANALLDSAKWTLDRNGEQYDPGTDDVRCKLIEGQLVALDLTMMYPAGNHIVDTLQENFIDNLNACGIRLTLVPEEMEELLKSYYREKDRTTDMIYLATNFHIMVDPSITYSTDKTLNHEIWNNTYSDDEELWYKAVDMRRTDPMDVFGYVSKWVSFQERYNEVLPTIPVYSNIYYDFYTDQLQNYFITGQVTWSQAILLAYFGDPSQLPEEPAEEEVGLVDDEAVFDD
jgi:ABC-type transport system substrate-binding protein